MANSALSVANTDFASIRADLKTYLGAQGNFKDYNFDGSNMAVLLDLLAYNTFMQTRQEQSTYQSILNLQQQ